MHVLLPEEQGPFIAGPGAYELGSLLRLSWTDGDSSSALNRFREWYVCAGHVWI